MLSGQSPWNAHPGACDEFEKLRAHADHRQARDLAVLIHDIACAAERVQEDGTREIHSLASILETSGACKGLYIFAAGDVVACCRIRKLGAQAQPRFSFGLLAVGKVEGPKDEDVVCGRAQGRELS